MRLVAWTHRLVARPRPSILRLTGPTAIIRRLKAPEHSRLPGLAASQLTFGVMVETSSATTWHALPGCELVIHAAPDITLLADEYCKAIEILSGAAAAAHAAKILSAGPLLALGMAKWQTNTLALAALFPSVGVPQNAYLGLYHVADHPQRLALTHGLLAALKDFAQKVGCTSIIGPVDRSSWYSYRLRIDDEQESLAWEPAHAPRLASDWKSFGFKDYTTYVSHAASVKHPIGMALATQLLLSNVVRAKINGFSVVPMNKIWQDNLPDIYRISHLAFAGSHLFEDISWANFVGIYADLDQRYDIRPSMLVKNRQGESIGFLIAFFDAGYLVIKSVGIAPAYKGQGLAWALVYQASLMAAASGISQAIGALIRSGNRPDSKTQLWKKVRIHKWTHRYQLLRLAI